MSLFDVPIQNLQGVGVKRAILFNKLGVNSIGDLILYYPRGYENWNQITNISDAKDGEVCCVKGYVATPLSSARVKSGMLVVNTTIIDDTGSLKLVFFNNKYISSMLEFNGEYYFYGKVERGLYGASMVSPKFVKSTATKSLRPIYNLTSGISNNFVESAVKYALGELPPVIKDPLPEFIRQKFNLCDYDFAIKNIHFPKTNEDLQLARQRLIFQELLILTLGLTCIKQSKNRAESEAISQDFLQEYLSILPFTLTNAQLRALQTCLSDMQSNRPMQRLIQGDVGSGKTVVAGGACYSAVKNGFQVAIMAPTEILATQHYNTFVKLFDNTGIRVGLLVGSMTVSQKRQIRSQIELGELDLIIGTHALITSDTNFKKLGLVITDEQHRFGVLQKARLTDKSKSAHLLVMSATPIPRTLGLTIFGDLDITVIDELPKGRQSIKTMLITSQKREKAFAFIRDEIDKGRQAYIVCPLIEEGEGELVSAETYCAELMLNYFADYPVGLLHGKMKPAEKDKVMQDFANGDISVLVTTTVVEVGVDVQNATVMMIENAERFGLSQLHQLRGRVGRGDQKSYCILLSDNKSEKSMQRLSVMCRTSDGFKIAEEDLKARGIGDLFGSRQHGLPELKIANLTDVSSVEQAQQASEMILKISPDLRNPEFRGIKAELSKLFKNTYIN